MKQRTIAGSTSYTGIALHTGNKSKITFEPAPENHGVEFIRTDLPGSPSVMARLENVIGITRGTTIGKDDVKIHTVEHVLAILMAFEIDNLIVKMDNNEPPVGDGSSEHFLQMINSVGITEQTAEKQWIIVDEPVWVEKGDVFLIALPSPNLRVSFVLSYKKTQLGDQYISLNISPDIFEHEIAPSRTFCFYNEVEELMRQGLIKGGSLDNAVVVGNDAIFSKEKLRFPEECVRHKILDVLGDLYLLGKQIKAHILAVKTGHGMNIELAKVLAKKYP